MTSATLRFAEALDIEAPNTAVVNIIDDDTDAVIVAAVHTSSPDPDTFGSSWAAAGRIEIPGAVLG